MPAFLPFMGLSQPFAGFLPIGKPAPLHSYPVSLDQLSFALEDLAQTGTTTTRNFPLLLSHNIENIPF